MRRSLIEYLVNISHFLVLVIRLTGDVHHEAIMSLSQEELPKYNPHAQNSNWTHIGWVMNNDSIRAQNSRVIAY